MPPTTNLADIARAALRHMAVNRMVPTPENYARAWEMVGGEPGPDKAGGGPGPDKAGGGPGPDHGPPTRPMVRGDLATEAAEAVRNANRRLRLMQTLVELVDTICEAVPELAWHEDWVAGQFTAIRRAVNLDNGLPERGALVQLRNDLRMSMESQARVRAMRRDALTELKSVLPQWLTRVSSLSDSSREYGEKLSHFTEKIETASSLEDLTSTLTGIVADTEAVRGRIDSTRGDLAATVQRAEELEVRVTQLSEQLSATNAELMSDDLTGLLNRRGFEAAFTEAWAVCATSGRPLSVAMMDLDDFKQVNDTRGHGAGDGVLRDFAQRILREFRPADRAARYGGDEFIVMLPGVGAESAAEVIRRLQRSQAALSLLGGPSIPPQRFSAGVSAVAEGDLHAALERADDALYEAKRAGKNRIVARG